MPKEKERTRATYKKLEILSRLARSQPPIELQLQAETLLRKYSQKPTYTTDEDVFNQLETISNHARHIARAVHTIKTLQDYEIPLSMQQWEIQAKINQYATIDHLDEILCTSDKLIALLKNKTFPFGISSVNKITALHQTPIGTVGEKTIQPSLLDKLEALSGELSAYIQSNQIERPKQTRGKNVYAAELYSALAQAWYQLISPTKPAMNRTVEGELKGSAAEFLADFKNTMYSHACIESAIRAIQDKFIEK